MPASIGVNLRVTGHCRQGGRKYMEDFFSVAYQQTEDERDLEYAFFGIYDGHGGAEAAAFAKEHLMETIIKHKSFWSDSDEDVLRAIKDGYIATHYAMWREQEKWPRTASGLPSTAGTTASVAFIRRGKIYIGHVGDSAIILGYQDPGSSEWRAKQLTRDHKPENLDEMTRINQCGGKVVSKSGVPRVVWNRPKMGHQGPVRRSTPIDEIPFLAVARSLGDLWSYNSQLDQFIVSPDPDCSVLTIDTNKHRCLVFGTDGLFNMLTPQNAVHIVQQAERHNENAALSDSISKTWLNPSKLLVEKALERWHNTKMRADNTSVVTLMLDPPGPPRAQVLKNRKKNAAYPDSGLKIMTRFEDDSSAANGSKQHQQRQEQQHEEDKDSCCASSSNHHNNNNNNNNCSSGDEENSLTATPSISGCSHSGNGRRELEMNEAEASPVTTSEVASQSYPLKERNFVAKPRESLSFDPREIDGKENSLSATDKDSSIQINEISSSSMDDFNDGELRGGDSGATSTSTVPTKPMRTKHNLRSSSATTSGIGITNQRRPPDGGLSKEADEDALMKRRKSGRLKPKDETAQAAEASRKRSLCKKTGGQKTKVLGLAQKILRSKKLNLKKIAPLKKKLKSKQKAIAAVKKQQRLEPDDDGVSSSKKVRRKGLRSLNATSKAEPSRSTLIPTTKPMAKRGEVQKFKRTKSGQNRRS